MTDTPDIEPLERIERWLDATDQVAPDPIPDGCFMGSMTGAPRGYFTKGNLRALCARVREMEGLLGESVGFIDEFWNDTNDNLPNRIRAALGKDEDNG
jgi:hypothetical protein